MSLLYRLSLWKWEEPGVDELLDELYDHLSTLFKKEFGVDSSYAVWCELNDKSKDALFIQQFVREFEVVDPHLTFWFCLVPYRKYIPVYWEQHKIIHNKKVEKEFPEERWRGLKL
jgi:hypothetical protein